MIPFIVLYCSWYDCRVYFFIFTISLFFPSVELFYLSHKLVDLYPNNPVSIDVMSLQTCFTLFEILNN